VLVLSESSKTAIGFAHCADARPGIEVPHGYQQRIASALQEFVGWSRGRLRVQHSHGATAAGTTWREVHAGRIPPDVGRVVSLWD